MLQRITLLLGLSYCMGASAIEVILEAPFLSDQAEAELCFDGYSRSKSECTTPKTLQQGKATFLLSQEPALCPAFDSASGILQPSSLKARVKAGGWLYTCVQGYGNNMSEASHLWPKQSLSTQQVSRIHLKLSSPSKNGSNCEIRFETPEGDWLFLLDVTRTQEACGIVPSEPSQKSLFAPFIGRQAPDEALIVGNYSADGNAVFNSIWLDGGKLSAQEFCQNHPASLKPLAAHLHNKMHELEAKVAESDRSLRWAAGAGAVVLGWSAYVYFNRGLWAGALLAAAEIPFVLPQAFRSDRPVASAQPEEANCDEPCLRQSQSDYHTLKRQYYDSMASTALIAMGTLPWLFFYFTYGMSLPF